MSEEAMTWVDLVAATTLNMVLLHRVDGGAVMVNPAQVTALFGPTGQQNKLMIGEARCVVRLADGKFISVIETCDIVRKLLETPIP